MSSKRKAAPVPATAADEVEGSASKRRKLAVCAILFLCVDVGWCAGVGSCRRDGVQEVRKHYPSLPFR